MHIEQTTAPSTNTREALIAAMMVFTLAQKRHALFCDALQNPTPVFPLEWLRDTHGVALEAEDAAHEDLMDG